jgi:hypothetical protein
MVFLSAFPFRGRPVSVQMSALIDAHSPSPSERLIAVIGEAVLDLLRDIRPLIAGYAATLWADWDFVGCGGVLVLTAAVFWTGTANSTPPRHRPRCRGGGGPLCCRPARLSVALTPPATSFGSPLASHWASQVCLDARFFFHKRADARLSDCTHTSGTVRGPSQRRRPAQRPRSASVQPPHRPHPRILPAHLTRVRPKRCLCAVRRPQHHPKSRSQSRIYRCGHCKKCVLLRAQ